MANIFEKMLSAPENLARAMAPRGFADRDKAVSMKQEQQQMLLDAIKEVKSAATPEERRAALERNQATLNAIDLFNISPYQQQTLDLNTAKAVANRMMPPYNLIISWL